MATAVEITRLDLTSEGLRREAARTRDAKVARRMLAIALVLDGADRTTAARSCGMDRQTLRDWVHRYNAEGLAGLSNRGGQGRKPLLSPEQKARLAAMVDAGPDPEVHGVVRWRRADLRDWVAAELAVEMHERTMGKHLKAMRYSHLSVRPYHPKRDAAAQQAFKKTSPKR